MKGRRVVTSTWPAAALVLLGLSGSGCPYETSIAPAGAALPLRASMVGRWTCRSLEEGGAEEKEWVALQIGWAGDAYLLTLRPPVIDPPDADEVPWLVRAKPMRLGAAEVWVLADDRRAPTAHYFARLDRSSTHELRFAVLGKGDGSLDKLPETSPAALARAFGDASRLGVERRTTCRRSEP